MMNVFKLLLLVCACAFADDFLSMSISIQNDSNSAVDIMFEQRPGRVSHLSDGRGIAVIEWPWAKVLPGSFQVMNGSVFSDEGTAFNIHIWGETQPTDMDGLLLQVKSNQVDYIDSIKCNVQSGILVCQDGKYTSALVTSGPMGHDLMVTLSGPSESQPLWMQ